jgi:4-amino-4-deoxy-L-arabinose transferase-like glycosyltransferase
VIARVRGFRAGLLLIAVAAVVIRIAHTLLVAPPTTGLEDAFWFRTVAHNLAVGRGFVDFNFHATAAHPPLYALFLAAAEKLSITGDEALRSLGALLGGATVLAVGLVGRRVGGERVGLLAAAIAAVQPLLIAGDGALLSETLYGPIVGLTLLAAFRLAERPTPGRAAVVGIAVGVATLTRSEALLLLPLLALPLAWRGTAAGRATRLAVATACTALVVAPWVGRNVSEFDRAVVANNDGAVLAAANCHAAYHGEHIGAFVETCIPRVSGDEGEQARVQQRQGVDYARDHAGRVPLVAGVRVLRTWSLFQPLRDVNEQGRSAKVQKLGVLFDYLLCVLAIAGVLALRHDRPALMVLLAPIVLVTVVAAATHGMVRLRHPAELSLAILAAAGAVQLTVAASRAKA